MEKINDIKKLEQIANEIRKDIIRMIASAASGHPGGSLGMADIFTCLYFSVLNHDPKKPFWKDRDRLLLSNGHVSPALYSAMAHAGYFKRDELMTFRKLGSRLQGHPHWLDLPGVEASTASLGQGIGIAGGIAAGGKIDSAPWHVYCLCGDGELDEGSCWEAAMFAAKYKLDNLTVIVDRNNAQIDGTTEDVMPLEPLAEKWQSFGFDVHEIDGHDMAQMLKEFPAHASSNANDGATVHAAAKRTAKPRVFIAKTSMGKGVSFMENNYKWHGSPPDEEQAKQALEELSG